MLLTATFSSSFLKVNAMPPHMMSELTYNVIVSVLILLTSNKLNNLVEHVIDELDFIRNLSTTQNSEERFVWVLQSLRKKLQFLLDKETGCTLRQFDANHTRVGAVGGAKCIVHVYIPKSCELFAEFSNLGRISLCFLPILVFYRALFLDMKAEILQEDNRPFS